MSTPRLYFEFGGLIASASPDVPDWNDGNRLIWDPFSKEIEAMRVGSPGPVVGKAKSRAEFRRFAKEWFAEVFQDG